MDDPLVGVNEWQREIPKTGLCRLFRRREIKGIIYQNAVQCTRLASRASVATAVERMQEAAPNAGVDKVNPKEESPDMRKRPCREKERNSSATYLESQ